MLSEISQREKKTNTIFYHLLVASKKKPKLVNRTHKKKQNRHRENKLVTTNGAKKRGKIGAWVRGTITMYKINYKHITYSTGNIANFYNNYTWTITCKNCESLCGTPETNIIL